MVVENVLRADQTLPSYQCRTAVVLRSYRQSWTDKGRELRPRSDGLVTIMTDRGGLLWLGTSAKNDRYSVTWATHTSQVTALPLVRAIPWEQSLCGQHGAHLGPAGPRWAPCWPHEPCYQGSVVTLVLEKQRGKIWVKISHESTWNLYYNHNKTKHNTTEYILYGMYSMSNTNLIPLSVEIWIWRKVPCSANRKMPLMSSLCPWSEREKDDGKNVCARSMRPSFNTSDMSLMMGSRHSPSWWWQAISIMTVMW